MFTPSISTTPRPLRLRLAVMMFLQYFVQGCYLPILSLYFKQQLQFSPQEIGSINSALAVGPLLAPLVVGQLVDRHFSTERVLAVCHALAGGTMLLLIRQESFVPVVVLGTLYSILYIPTLMLTNSLAMCHLANRDREFPGVRLWGTIGFVLPAWLIEGVWLRGLEGAELHAARGSAFILSGLAGLGLALYCLTLPSTPPSSVPQRSFAPGQLLGLLRRRDVAVLVGVSLLIALVHQFYFVWNGPFLSDMLLRGGVTGAYEQRLSSLGQMSEVIVLALLGGAVTRWGFKRVMLLGTSAYLLRCLLFAGVPLLGLPFEAGISLVAVGQALHGVCFACFLATAYMFLDRVAPRDARGSTQSMYGTLVLGSGAFLGGILGGWIGARFTTGANESAIQNWPAIWGTCAAMALAAGIIFALLFPRDSQTVPESSAR